MDIKTWYNLVTHKHDPDIDAFSSLGLREFSNKPIRKEATAVADEKDRYVGPITFLNSKA